MDDILKKQLSAIAANIVHMLHAIFAFFAVFGGFLFLIEPKILIVHIPVVIWSSLANLANWTCPLTPLEKWFRQLAGQPSFTTGWIQHYFEPLFRPLGMPCKMEFIAGISIVVWNVLLYIVLWRFYGT